MPRRPMFRRVLLFSPVVVAFLVMLPRLLSPQFGLLDDGMTLRAVAAVSHNWTAHFTMAHGAGRFFPSYFFFLFLVHALAGPHPLRFFAANLLGAIRYVPWPVLAGYDLGYGLGDWIERLRRAAGLKEDLALFAAILGLAGVAFVAMTWARDWRAARPPGRGDERDT